MCTYSTSEISNLSNHEMSHDSAVSVVTMIVVMPTQSPIHMIDNTAPNNPARPEVRRTQPTMKRTSTSCTRFCPKWLCTTLTY